MVSLQKRERTSLVMRTDREEEKKNRVCKHILDTDSHECTKKHEYSFFILMKNK